MKHLLKFLCFAMLMFVVGNIANAQRTREFKSNNSNRSSSGSRGNNYSSTRSAPVRTFSNPSRTFNNNNRNSNSDRNVTYRNETSTAIRNTPSNNRSTETMRYRPGTNSSERNVSRNSAYRGGNTIHNNYRYNNTSYRTNSYGYNRYGYGNHYGNVYGRRTVFMYGPRYQVIPSTFVSIHFGGNPYYYNRGYYYGYYGGYYQPIFPPFGLRINVLPFGYTRFLMGLDPFFYYNGIYYRQYDSDSYEVVDAPMGATVSSLPKGARSVIINGEKLYELNGTYYKADRNSNGNDVFTVVGKNGVIDNTPDAENNLNAASQLQMGDTISELPEGSKVVTINGRELYETPNNIYLEENSENGVIQYKVIGQ